MEEAGILEKITRSGFCYPALNQVSVEDPLGLNVVLAFQVVVLNFWRRIELRIDRPDLQRIRIKDRHAKAVRKNYFSNLDDDDGAKWSSSNPARPSEA